MRQTKLWFKFIILFTIACFSYSIIFSMSLHYSPRLHKHHPYQSLEHHHHQHHHHHHHRHGLHDGGHQSGENGSHHHHYHHQSKTVEPRKTKNFLLWLDKRWFFKAGIFEAMNCEYSECHAITARHQGELDKLMPKLEAVLAVGRPYFLNYRSFSNFVLSRKLPETAFFFSIREPPCITGPFSEFSNVFHFSMTYRWDSDIYFPYALILPKDPVLRESWRIGGDHSPSFAPFNPRLAPSVKSSPPPPNDILWIVSNCQAPSGRKGYVKRLRAALGDRMVLDQYGKCNRRPLGHWNVFNSTKYQQYRFYLAFENSLCQDYVTEKFFNVLKLDSVIPIVRGANKTEYARMAPPHSYIHVNDFATVKDLADYLVYLKNNPIAFNEYFWWKELYRVQIFNGFLGHADEFAQWVPDRLNPFCNFCRLLHTVNQTYLEKKGTIDHFSQFWLRNKCRNPYPN